MARLFGLVSTLVLSGAQAYMYTQDCNSSWHEATVHRCFDSDYNKSFVCGPSRCENQFEGVLDMCHGTDRGDHAQILLEYCEDPSSKNCSEAHDIFDFVDCKSGMTRMCSDDCIPYLRVMSMNCTREMIPDDDEDGHGTMSNLKEVSTMMLDTCSDKCAMHFDMFSNCMQFGGEDFAMVCRPECKDHVAALEAEPCFSQTLPNVSDPSGNHTLTYGEFTAQFQFELLCHPCYMLYSDATLMYHCASEHGDCSQCQDLVDQMREEPLCSGTEPVSPGGPSYVELVARLAGGVDYYCDNPPPQRQCHMISQEFFEHFGAIHCDDGH